MCVRVNHDDTAPHTHNIERERRTHRTISQRNLQLATSSLLPSPFYSLSFNINSRRRRFRQQQQLRRPRTIHNDRGRNNSLIPRPAFLCCQLATWQQPPPIDGLSSSPFSKPKVPLMNCIIVLFSIIRELPDEMGIIKGAELPRCRLHGRTEANPRG